MSNYNFINFEISNMTSIISFNRPEVYNALNKEAKLEILKALEETEKMKNIGAIIITGEGKAFCTGQDLNDRSVKANEEAVDLGHTLETEWNPLVKFIKKSKKIVIGAINGVCAGAGLPLAMSCDLIVAKPGVKFISGFSRLGLAPDAGSTFTFAKTLGYQKTLEFFLFNNPLTSEDLLENKLVNFIQDDPLAFAKELSQKVNGLAPESVNRIKQNIQFALEGTYEKSMEREIDCQRFLGNSENYKEGLKAFFEKRKPQFLRE
jgi:2-(1,2-epoxy-1,2-dihydrophenyl)acetyl-CoA isomerase